MKLIQTLAAFCLLALFPKFSSAQFEDTASVLEWLETECATDTTELSEYCDLIEYAVLCLEGDSVYCDSLDWALEGLDISDASDSTDTSGDDGSDVGDGLEDDGDDDESDDDDDESDDDDDDESDDDDDDESDDDDDDESDDDDNESDDDDDDESDDDDNMNNWTVQDWADYFIADCAEDSTGMDEACAYVVLSESCLAGDSLACAELELGITMYEDGDDEDDEDDYDDGYDDEGDDDDDGLTAAEEGEWGTDPNNNDSDGDGLTDGDEVNLFNLSPTNPDTDGNGVSDPVDLVFLLLEQNANGGGIPEVDPCPSDINKDGTVTVTDMLIFLSDFGTICF